MIHAYKVVAGPPESEAGKVFSDKGIFEQMQ